MKRDSCDPNISKGSAMIYGQCSLDFYDRWKTPSILIREKKQARLGARVLDLKRFSRIK